MRDGVVYHEMGHDLAKQIVGPVHNNVYVVFALEDNILHSLGEAMADWAPPEKDGCKKGSFLRWAEIAERENFSAQRSAWFYPTDNWFPDGEETEFLPFRSNVLVSIFFLVTKGAYVDFNKVKSEQPRIFDMLKENLILVTDKLMSLIYSAQYKKEGKQCRYEDLEPEFLKKFEKTTKAELQQVYGFWRDIRKDWLLPDEALWKQVQDILTEEGKKFQKKLLDMINEEGNGHYFSLRDFIIKKCIQIQEYLAEKEYLSLFNTVNTRSNKVLTQKSRQKASPEFFAKILGL